MNDASGERIASEAAAIEPDKKKEEDESHMDDSRWWYASSVFPMVAGTLGPVASAFSICALVRPWRQSYPPGTSIQTAPYIPDPHWLDIVNAVQLAIALVANMALLLNMTRRVRFAIAQPITIVGWYISAFCLAGLTGAGAGPLKVQPDDQFVWSQAFYYAVYSAVIYFFVASLMAITFYGASAGHYPKDFVLTTSQRTLMLQTIMFLIYLLVGALVYSHIEGWSYLDSVYWADVTLFTVGFGDFAPKTNLGRALLFPYALIGIISLGLVIGSIRTFVLERGRRRFDARIIEKKRERIIRKIIERGKDDVLIPVRDHPDALSTGSSETGWTELERREAEFRLMRKIQDQAALRRRWMAMSLSSSVWIVLWLVGAKVFQECESKYQGWTYFKGMYMAFESLTTIGYGDTTPISNAGKSFFVLWSLLALPATTVLISNAGDTVVKGIKDVTNHLGNVTILPGERGFRRDLKAFLHAITCGMLFPDEEEEEEQEQGPRVQESAPGFLGNADPVSDTETDDDDDVMRKERRDLEREKNELRQKHGDGDPAAEGKQQKQKQEQDGSSSHGSAENGAEINNEKQSPDKNNNNSNGNGTKKAVVTFSDSAKPPKSPKPFKSPPTRPARGPFDNILSQTVTMTRPVSIPRPVLPRIPTNKADYHLTLIEEIKNVTHHLKSHPPRKYTFQEWAWYLKLIGEDESNADLHKKPRPYKSVREPGAEHQNNGPEHQHHEHQHGQDPGIRMPDRHAHHHPHHAGHDSSSPPHQTVNGAGGTSTMQAAAAAATASTAAAGQGHGQWSWVGSRSPLMGSQEEAEWILDKLTQKLAEELREESRLQRGGHGRSTHGPSERRL